MTRTPYKGCQIEVITTELPAGGHGILKIGVWTREGGHESYAPLAVATPQGFPTAEDAETAGVRLAVRAIERGQFDESSKRSPR